MAKFIHTADWQIGMKAAHVGAAAETVRAQRLESARRVVQVAKEQNVEFTVVAGDTFEDNAVDRVLVQKVADILGSFPRPVYIIPGNHDPLVPGSVWNHPAWKSHGNVYLLAEASPLEIDGATLYPSPLGEKHSLKDPTRWMDAHDSKRIAVGIAHGTVEGVSQDALDYPIARDAATRAGLDYLALGHWHSTAMFADGSGDTRMAYSGTHETTKFGERDSGNVLLVEIAERGRPPRLTQIPTGGFGWESLEEDIREPDDLTRIREMLELKADPHTTLLDLRLKGVLHQESQAELARISEIIQARFLYGRVDTSGLIPRPDDDSWLADVPVGVMREVARQLQRLSDPTGTDDRPDYATPEVATRAMLELYRMLQETKR
ncbi:MAG: hypothetical protein A2V98_05530 [Planctomycetes bacterium RBG_16_64_12]|nr:MAG: hypothetical protein A2V98_05530 [Planctomycetes bacterium RBG_16_64_12]